MTLVILYPFQQVSVDKLKLIAGSLIADEMGLGKTPQAIELDKCRRAFHETKNPTPPTSRRTLIVAPLSTIGGWCDHLDILLNSPRVSVIDRKNRDTFTASLKQDYDYYICHWEALRLIPELAKVVWFHVILDECHRMKNIHAAQTKAAKKIKAVYKTAMSGTAADDKPQDLYSVLNWLYPRTWSSKQRFEDTHILFAEKTNYRTGHKYKVVVGVAEVESLHHQLNPFYVRRLKKDVCKELPPKYYTNIHVDLTPKQRRAYDDMRKDMLAWVGVQEDEPLAAHAAIAKLVRLQQLAVAYGEIVTTYRDHPSGIRVPVDKLNLSDPSAKLDALMELISDSDPANPIVVFGQSKQAINLLSGRLRDAKISHVILTGDTKQEDRARGIQEFQAGKHRVFAGTIAAGGVGITLTAASTVVFLDRTWNPSLNIQAEDRLHRIGQAYPVQVINLVARNTIDPDRMARIDIKMDHIRQILGDSNGQ